MTDSIQLVDDSFVNRIHSHRPIGKLHKGHQIVAATSSIPSKYQTIVIDNGDRKGFQSTAKRFQHDSVVNDNPGPGNYVGHASAEKRASSFSKKGTGGFASKDRRVHKPQVNYSPGPAAYGLPGLVTTRNDYNRTVTSTFHKPIAVQRRDTFDNGLPAANEYDVDKSRRQVNKSNNVSAASCFKSQSKRELLNVGEAKTKPSPCQYNVNDDLVKDSVKVPMSSFKSKTERRMQADPPSNPGPGAYKPHEPVEPAVKTIFPRKHYLCISAPAMPLPDTPPGPGPANYDIPRFEGAPKHYMSGAAFVSTTSRWTGDGKMAEFPSPAQYKPTGQGKQSFIYNAAGRWI